MKNLFLIPAIFFLSLHSMGQDLIITPISEIQGEVVTSKGDDPLTNGPKSSGNEPAKSIGPSVVLNTSQILTKIANMATSLPSHSEFEALSRVLYKTELAPSFFQEIPMGSESDLLVFLYTNNLSLQSDLAFDRVLIRFLYQQKLKLEGNFPSHFEDSEASPLIKKFFQSRIISQISLNLATSQFGKNPEIQTVLFNTYAELTLLVEQKDWIYDSLKNLIPSLNFEKLNASALHLLKDISFSKLNDFKSSIPDSEISALFSLAETFASKIEVLKQIFQVDVDWLNSFNQFVDRFILKQSDFAKVVELLDVRQRVNQIFFQSLAGRVIKIKKPEDLSLYIFTVSHPILTLYYKKALAVIYDTGFQPEADIASLLWINKTIDLPTFLSRELGQLNNISGINLDNENPNQGLGEISQKSTAQLIRYYFSGFSQVEFARYYLNFNYSSIIFGKPAMAPWYKNKPNPIQEKLRSNYKMARTLLQTTLCIRYGQVYEKNYSSCDIIGNLNGNQFFTPTKAQPIVSKYYDNEITMPISKLKINLKGPTFVPAGIYYSDADIDMTAYNISFHPLSVIYTYGHSFKLTANEISDLWLDTSGGDQLQNRLVPPIGASATEDGQAGSPPPKPIRANDGGHAGKIEITGKLHFSTVIAMGGNGQNGFDGGASPQCQNDVYSSVVHKWTTTINRPKDCGQCYYLGADICNNDGNRRQACGGENISTEHSEILDTANGLGGDAGNGGNGGAILVYSMGSNKLNRFFSPGGLPGKFGKGGRCGTSEPALNGSNGTVGEVGIDNLVFVFN